jgi:hypothetical protein
MCCFDKVRGIIPTRLNEIQMNAPTNRRRIFRNGIVALSPNCREATFLQSQAFHRRLPFLTRLGLKIHLLLCKWCRRNEKQITFLRSAICHLSGSNHSSPTRLLSVEAHSRIKSRLQSGNNDSVRSASVTRPISVN